MSKLTQILRTIMAVSAFFAVIYLNDLWMYLAPTHRLRRWGATTRWPFHPAWLGEASGDHRE